MLFTPWHRLLEICCDAQEVVLAAPYIKTGTLEQILSRITGRLYVISRWSLPELGSGVSDIGCRQLVVDYGGKFLLHPTLHAKYYRFDNQILIGSANLTATGMGYGQKANLEILCPAPDDFDTTEMEAVLFQDAHELTDWEVDQWTVLSQTIVEEGLVSPHPSPPNLRDWSPRTRAPYHVWLAYAGRMDMIASGDQRVLAQRDLLALSVPSGLSEIQFHTWIAGCLLLSGFFMDVASLENEENDNRAAIYRLADDWSITPRTAARKRGTALAWLAYFFE